MVDEGPGYDLERRIHWTAQLLVGSTIGGLLGAVEAVLGWTVRHVEGLPGRIALGGSLLWMTMAVFLVAQGLRRRRNVLVHVATLAVLLALAAVGWSL